MYKKIMFLIITLSIIISVGNSTVVMAKENIVTEIVDFPVTINYEEYCPSTSSGDPPPHLFQYSQIVFSALW